MTKQQSIPGTEPKKDKAISSKAHAYVEVRDEHRVLTAKLVEKKQALIDEMRRKEVTTYNDGELVVIVDEKVSVKVRDAEDASADDEDLS